jgi:RNA polymerase sigma-70 factor (ECF subfamily)
MTRRLTRAKNKIVEAGIPYRVPTGRALAGVLAVLYLLFTRGYDADGEPAFASEAIR